MMWAFCFDSANIWHWCIPNFCFEIRLIFSCGQRKLYASTCCFAGRFMLLTKKTVSHPPKRFFRLYAVKKYVLPYNLALIVFSLALRNNIKAGTCFNWSFFPPRVTTHLLFGIRMVNLCLVFWKYLNMSGVGNAPSKDTKSNSTFCETRYEISSCAISTFDRYFFLPRVFLCTQKSTFNGIFTFLSTTDTHTGTITFSTCFVHPSLS